MNTFENRENPFNRPTPFSRVPFTPMIKQQKPFSHNSLIYRPSLKHPKINIWPYHMQKSTYHSHSHGEARSDFQKQVQSSLIMKREKTTTSGSRVWDNPFHRKNLLVSEDKVREQVQLDLSQVKSSAYLPGKKDSDRFNMKESKYIYDYATQMNEPQYTPYLENRSSFGKDTPRKKNPYEEQREREKISEQKENKVRESRKIEAVRYQQENNQFKTEIIVRGKKFYRNTVFNRNDYPK